MCSQLPPRTTLRYDKFVKLFPINIYRSPLEAWEVRLFLSVCMLCSPPA